MIAELMLGSLSTMLAVGTPIQVHYIPFQVETYSPVTMATIAQQAACVLSMKSDDPAIRIVQAAVNGEPVHPLMFSNKNVRLRVTSLDGAEVFATSDGYLMKVDRLTGRSEVMSADLSKLDGLLRAACKHAGPDRSK